MKPEITFANRIRFEANYVDQDVLRSVAEPNISGNLTPRLLGRPYSKYDWLELKSLADISEEDAIEVADILRGIDGFDRCVRSGDVVNIYWKDKSRLTLYNHSAGYSLDDGYMESINGTFDDLDYIDFLRSRGYALPWMGLSVEELIAAGWIKLRKV